MWESFVLTIRKAQQQKFSVCQTGFIFHFLFYLIFLVFNLYLLLVLTTFARQNTEKEMNKLLVGHFLKMGSWGRGRGGCKVNHRLPFYTFVLILPLGIISGREVRGWFGFFTNQNKTFHHPPLSKLPTTLGTVTQDGGMPCIFKSLIDETSLLLLY